MKLAVVTAMRLVTFRTYRVRPTTTVEEPEVCVGFQQTWTNEFCD